MALPDPQVSLKLRLSPVGENSEWFTALNIPLSVFRSVGVLSLDQNEEISCDMDVLVNAGDVYYFYVASTIHFVDPDVITTITSQNESPNRIPIRTELIRLYEACPFTGFPGDICHACHLIPHVKGDEHIRHFTQERSGGLMTIERIDDIRNMLLLNPSLHKCLGKRIIAFLQTPNVVLKTNDVVENADPEAYRVTIHCFTQYGPDALTLVGHGKSAILSNEATRPPEVIYSMIYGNAALNAWAPLAALALVKAHGGTRTRGSDPAGKERERAKKEKEARRERARNRNPDRPEGTSQDEDFDMFDMLLAFRYATQGSPEDLRKAAEEERRIASAEKVQAWLTGH